MFFYRTTFWNSFNTVEEIIFGYYLIDGLSQTYSNRCVFTFLSWFNFLAFQQKWVRISEWVYSHMMGYCNERSIMYLNHLLTHIYMICKKSFLHRIQKDLLTLYTLIRIWWNFNNFPIYSNSCPVKLNIF